MSRKTEVAEDLTQETFCKAILSLPDSHTNARAWLYTVARNLCFDYFRRTARNVTTELDEKIPDDDLCVEEIVFCGIRNRMLEQAILRLDDRKREVITLQYFSGMSVKEIASFTRLSPENVRVLICRAKKEIKRYMEEHGYDVP